MLLGIPLVTRRDRGVFILVHGFIGEWDKEIHDTLIMVDRYLRRGG